MESYALCLKAEEEGSLADQMSPITEGSVGQSTDSSPLVPIRLREVIEKRRRIESVSPDGGDGTTLSTINPSDSVSQASGSSSQISEERRALLEQKLDVLKARSRDQQEMFEIIRSQIQNHKIFLHM